MRREIIRITAGNHGEQFYLDFYCWRLPPIGLIAGWHKNCGGLVSRLKNPESRSSFVLRCACGLMIVMPLGTETKEQVLDFFINQLKTHEKGSEVRACLNCRGQGQLYGDPWQEVIKWMGDREGGRNGRNTVRKTCETIPCPECKGTGLLEKEAVAV